MNTTAPQNPFVPAPPPFQPLAAETSLAATERPKRRAGRPAKAVKAKKVKKPPRHNLAAQVATLGADSLLPPTKKPRKPRVAKKAKAPRASAGKLGINEIVSATVGLKAEEAKALLAVVSRLGDLSKGGKVKVTAALGKLFG